MNSAKTSDVGETFEWTVRSYECAPDGKVTVANICNYLQEAASINAEHLGFSKTDFDEDQLNVTWVMTRLRVCLTRRPKWNERVRVFTFPRPARRIVAWRDFILSDGEGREIGRASTEWMMIDMTSRRPVAIPAFVTERANTVRTSVFAEPLGFKVDFSALTPSAEPYAIRAAASDIDLNGHVNNVRYITWLFDALDRQGEPIDFELAFRGEVLKGGEVTVETYAGEGATYQRIKSTTDHVLAKISL